MAFKRRLADAIGVRSGEKLSKATVHSTLRDLKAFFEWLSREPGFRSQIAYSDADYFNLSEKDVAVARARREKAAPTPSRSSGCWRAMPAAAYWNVATGRWSRSRPSTGARVNALASFQLGHVDLTGGFVDQDARIVRTKFAKTFRTYFMPVVEGASEIVENWIAELREVHLWGPADPLFPATAMGLDEAGGFLPQGLARQGWASTGPIREIFRRAFAAAGLPYFNPHSFRDMLVRHAMTLDLTPEEMKAWSQNLGHTDVLTTFTSYGTVPVQRQGELIRAAGPRKDQTGMDDGALLAALTARLKKAG